VVWWNIAQEKEAAAFSSPASSVPASAGAAAAGPLASPVKSNSLSSQALAPPPSPTPAEALRTLRAEIDAENQRSVAGMSPEEIVEAQAELSRRLPAPVLAMLRKRGAARVAAVAASSEHSAAASAPSAAVVDHRGGIHPPAASSARNGRGGASHTQQTAANSKAAEMVSSASSPTSEQGLWAGGGGAHRSQSAGTPDPSPSRAESHGAFMPQTIRFALDGGALNWPGGGSQVHGEEVRAPLFPRGRAWKRCLRRGVGLQFMALLYVFVAACDGSLGTVLRCPRIA
jgi:hypothetical protein